MRRPTEYENFDKTMHDLIKVPHEELKAELERERAEKAKLKAKNKPSASGRVADDKG